MDAVELPLPTAVVTKLMRSSGVSAGGGGGGSRVEMVKSQVESASSSHSPKGNNCSVNDSRPVFRNRISDIDFHSQGSQRSNLCNGEHDMGHIQNSFDMTSVSQAKQSQGKSGKASRSIGNYSRRSQVTRSLDVNSSSKELESCPGSCSISEKIQPAKQKTISVKRSEKRMAKISKSKCYFFSIKAGLSSFSFAAGGNNILGLYSLKHDIYDVAEHLDEVSLNELLDDGYKRLQYIKDKQKKTETLSENILQSVKDACSVLQLRKSSPPPILSLADVTYHQNSSSCLPNSGIFGDSKSDDHSSSSSNKVKDSCSRFTNQPYYIVDLPLLSPKDVLNRLSLPPHKDLDPLLLGIMKPTSMSKGNVGRRGLPSFPWSHISGSHYKTNSDLVKLTTPNKSTCKGRWVKIGNSILSFGDTTNFLADLGSLAYDQSIVPLRPGVCTIATNTQDGHAPGVLAAAQTLCEIATLFYKQDQSMTIRWPKKPSQKSLRANKLKLDYQLEKTLVISSQKLRPTKRPFTTAISSRLSEKHAKLRKLVPMESRTLPNKHRSAS